MQLRVIAVGTRMPGWVTEGWNQYAERLRDGCRLELLEIPLTRRGRGIDDRQAVAQEAQRILAAVNRDRHVIALDVAGKSRDTLQLADDLARWLREGRDIDFLIGGPDGLSPEVLELAAERWSLSPLTFPHGLTRVLVAEQLYRAWTILRGHPYHRR